MNDPFDDVVAQFYPWFKFSFLLLQTHYHVIIIHYHIQKQKKRKFEPRIKLNHNNDITWLVMKDSALLQNLVAKKSSKPHSTVTFGHIVKKRSTFFNVTVSPIVLSFET